MPPGIVAVSGPRWQWSIRRQRQGMRITLVHQDEWHEDSHIVGSARLLGGGHRKLGLESSPFGIEEIAGIDGILNKIDPGEPLDKDIYDLAPEELAKVPSAPGSLDEALKNLERDHDFLLRGDVFTEEVIDTWISYKMEKEVKPMALRPHPYEFHLYYDA